MIIILFFFHMFIGLMTGMVLTSIRPDKLIIPVCMAYSIIPDILDKYLGLTYTEFGSGRTVAHSLLYVGVLSLMVIVVLAIIYRRTILILAVSASLLFHQLLDEMWKLPTTWFYPLLGKFSTDLGELGTPGGWFWGMVWREVTSPVEWIAGVSIIIVLVLWYNKRWKNIYGSRNIYE